MAGLKVGETDASYGLAESLVCEVAVLIVGYRNAEDVVDCLQALSRATTSPAFDIFICENGGRDAYLQLVSALISEGGPCRRGQSYGTGLDGDISRFTDVQRLSLRARSSNVWVGCAFDNLGYAGGINAWLRLLSAIPTWRAIWILNPDTQPTESALAALHERAESGRKAMVGSTILDSLDADHVRFRGGLSWRRLAARDVAIGLGELLDVSCNVAAVEDAMDSPSGASMYVTRWCIERIGLMDESFFLFYEDMDWGLRARHLGLGYAAESIVVHKRGTTTGSGRTSSAIPVLSVYLQHRNCIRFVRRHFPWSVPLRIAVSLMYAFRFLLQGAPNNSRAAVEGLVAGLKGEMGRPEWHTEQVSG
ncbi:MULTISPECIES: glycosyltransferase family 2 protein [unclassified Bradyrhizobium]|uniref:glycosyltransferase family 2 protein n=1 Tax=unclassified Bradyrhizobium TaxID=2631580 RepID=UPI001FF8DB45|nr:MULTISPECIES: glycosyltransferase family 2 protein [unclassified Bradyrhizobium]MCK1313550.1 glycosyltransferase family 2 protein [Bradyrhizobium sp. 23]MCK1450493.1 glycosyltransferase family 2 protein [Bradyrhizobium sp. 35]MCK1507604.1 glycosyltransferase family 2 protein [Bradyrhizobium sp. 18]